MNSFSVHKINVAIDGPAGAGKSTVARKVAEKLGYIYVDTGAMYRAVTLKALRAGLTAENTARLIALAQGTDIRLVPSPDGQRVLMDGEDVTRSIRSDEVTANVSSVSAIPEIRDILVRKQREIAKERGVVMDGRDIGTKVLPDAEVKVYLTASAKVRAERRYQEMNAAKADVSLAQLMDTIAERDRMDMERAASPLKQAEDASYLDSSEMDLPQVVESVLELCRRAVEE